MGNFISVCSLLRLGSDRLCVNSVTGPQEFASYSCLLGECHPPKQLVICSSAPAPETVSWEGLCITDCIYHLGSSLLISPCPLLSRGEEMPD